MYNTNTLYALLFSDTKCLHAIIHYASLPIQGKDWASKKYYSTWEEVNQ